MVETEDDTSEGSEIEMESAEELVIRTFKALFPDSFEGLVAVREHEVSDLPFFPIVSLCPDIYSPGKP